MNEQNKALRNLFKLLNEGSTAEAENNLLIDQFFEAFEVNISAKQPLAADWKEKTATE